MKGLTEQEVIGLKGIIRGAAHVIIGVGRHIRNVHIEAADRLIEDGIDEVIKGCETVASSEKS